MQGYVGSLVTTLLRIYSSKRILKIGYQGIFQWKKDCKSIKIWQNYAHEYGVQFFAHPVNTK